MDLTALMQSVKDGDREALSKLCSIYQTELYNSAIERTDNADEARLVVKAVFKEMYKSIREKGPYEGDVSAWLHQLADNELRSLWHNRIQNALEKPVAFAGEQAKAESHADIPESVPAPQPIKPRQYTPEEARELEARVDARLLLDDMEDEDDDDYDEKSGILPLAALIGLSALLMWMLIGFLSSLGILPETDLGYNWFNETLFRLF